MKFLNRLDLNNNPLDNPVYTLSPWVPGGRLTLTNGVPVTTADVTSAGTLYYAPWIHDQLALYDGTRVRNYGISTGVSLTLSGLTSGKNYDVYAYQSGGTPALEPTAWTSDTTRATGLAWTNGIYCKSGDATRRYLGTIRTISTSATCDWGNQRFVWNYFNRQPRPMIAYDDSHSHMYTGTTWRAWNGGTATPTVEWVQGEAAWQWASVSGGMSPYNTYMYLGVGIDITNGTFADVQWGGNAATTNVNVQGGMGNYAACSAAYHVAKVVETGGANSQPNSFGNARVSVTVWG